jgi:hypothetical protein
MLNFPDMQRTTQRWQSVRQSVGRRSSVKQGGGKHPIFCSYTILGLHRAAGSCSICSWSGKLRHQLPWWQIHTDVAMPRKGACFQSTKQRPPQGVQNLWVPVTMHNPKDSAVMSRKLRPASISGLIRRWCSRVSISINRGGSFGRPVPVNYTFSFLIHSQQVHNIVLPSEGQKQGKYSQRLIIHFGLRRC